MMGLVAMASRRPLTMKYYFLLDSFEKGVIQGHTIITIRSCRQCIMMLGLVSKASRRPLPMKHLYLIDSFEKASHTWAYNHNNQIMQTIYRDDMSSLNGFMNTITNESPLFH